MKYPQIMRTHWLFCLLLSLAGLTHSLEARAAQLFEIFPVNKVWKYNVASCLDGTGWELPNYDDGTWESGPGGFTGGELSAFSAEILNTTSLPAPNAPSQVPPGHAMYFRTTFTLDSITNVFLILSNAIDDAAVFHLNGVRVAHLRMPSRPALCAEFGGQAAGPAVDALLWEVIQLSPEDLAGILHPGVNVLAVEVHQTTANSSDMVFAMVLMGQTSPFRLPWSTMDGGGGASSNSNFTVHGTIGQLDAVKLSGSTLAIEGGFWGFITSVPMQGAPRLTITRTPTNTVVVSWPSPSTGFLLQQNTDLNTASWVEAPEEVNDNGPIKFIVVNPPVGNRFYRLFKP